MDKKSIIIIVLCIVVIIFWGQIAEYLGLVKPLPPKPITQTQDTTWTQPPPAPIEQPTQPVAAVDSLAAIQDMLSPIDTMIPEQIFTITTPLHELTFTNYGGGIKEIILQNYFYKNGDRVILAESSDNIVPDFETAGGAYRANRLIFSCDQADYSISAGDSPKKITFVYDNMRGGRIFKTYIISPDKYDIDFEITVEGIETFGFERDYQLVWGITPAPTEENLNDDYGYFKAVAYMDDDMALDDFENGRLNEDIPGTTKWAGLRIKYFAAIMIPQSREGTGVIARGTKQKETINEKSIEVRNLAAGITMPIATRGNVTDNYKIYMGPIDYKILKNYNNGLEELTSLGWVIIKPFSIAIIWLLPKIYSVIPNYGVVVLIFALLIKIIIYPLSRKQTIAMTKMRELAPKQKKIQEKYKSDPAKMQKEMMKLYKEAGANPMSGCLPLLPQMPLFFALFTVFKTTIEFRGASFMGWITDLSVPDPLYVLPIFMVITMFIQQKITLTDPKQKMMIYIMPLVFGWLFMNFPAGLVLYWTGFNVLSLIETVFIRKKQMPELMVEEIKD